MKITPDIEKLINKDTSFYTRTLIEKDIISLDMFFVENVEDTEEQIQDWLGNVNPRTFHRIFYYVLNKVAGNPDIRNPLMYFIKSIEHTITNKAKMEEIEGNMQKSESKEEEIDIEEQMRIIKELREKAKKYHIFCSKRRGDC